MHLGQFTREVEYLDPEDPSAGYPANIETAPPVDELYNPDDLHQDVAYWNENVTYAELGLTGV